MCPASEIPITQRVTEIRQQLPDKFPEKDRSKKKKAEDEEADSSGKGSEEKQHSHPAQGKDPNKGGTIDYRA